MTVTPTSHSSICASTLNDALLRARQAHAAQNTDLLTELLRLLQVDEDTLAAALLTLQGVTIISDTLWATALNDASIQTAAGLAPADGLLVVAKERVYLLSPDPWLAPVAMAARRLPDPNVQLVLANAAQWLQAASRMQQALPEAGSVNKTSNSASASSTTTTNSLPAETTDVVGFVDDAVAQAYREGASDIHFETSRSGIGIKFRLDGVMAGGPRLDDPQKAEEVVSRIKVMAQLDITERRRPQDGRIHWNRAGHHPMDLRVSVMPSIFGEDVVLRLLDKAQLNQGTPASSQTDASQPAGLTLNTLGFEGQKAKSLRGLASRPHGMLLITGPTGSGKTTTVYAALSEVNDGLEKIVTIEDPVEYELTGVLQIPVNEQKGLTFATGLRSILRHDPDKILVGEIRDPETAQIAVQSSLTGHLVFTTVHANSLFDVLGRFQHFGIEPFALASALNGVVVQRLMRRLCAHCHRGRDVKDVEAQLMHSLEIPVPDQVPRAVGCPHCRMSGYRGRFVVAEIHVLTDSVRDLIAQKAAMSELRVALYPKPSGRLLAQALTEVSNANTTLEEVNRVVGLV